MVEPADALFRNLLQFGRLLRRAGVNVPAGRMADVVLALEYVGVARRADIYYTLRALLVRRPQDLRLFDLAFRLFWRARASRPSGVRVRSLDPGAYHRMLEASSVEAPLPAADLSNPTEAATSNETAGLSIYSARDVLQTKDFASFTVAELAQATTLMSQLTWDLGSRRTRRWTAGRRGPLDLRRAVRRNMRHGGEIVELTRRTRQERPPPLVLLCDISGSMERYTRMLLHFICALARRRPDVEAFLFATRLTRITPHLTGVGIDAAIAAVAHAVPDWAGGTRIGDALDGFNRRWARRVLGRRAIVLLISDGWDRGDPDVLRQEVARLQRSCHRLIWLNPLLGSPGYQPLTRGLQAALPFVDDFLPVHNLASLESLVRRLNALRPRGSAGRRSQPLRDPPVGV